MCVDVCEMVQMVHNVSLPIRTIYKSINTLLPKFKSHCLVWLGDGSFLRGEFLRFASPQTASAIRFHCSIANMMK